MAKSLARVPMTRLSPFGPPPLLRGENAAAYDALLAQVSGAVKPADILEEIWVHDIVNLVWEISRLRRFKTSLLTVSAHEGLKDILQTFMAYEKADDLATCWAARDRSAIKKVDKLLAAVGLTMDAVMAQTLTLDVGEIDRMALIERIDQWIMGAESRRNTVLREIDRHRASLAQALRRVSEEVQDVQFEEVESKQIADRSAA